MFLLGTVDIIGEFPDLIINVLACEMMLFPLSMMGFKVGGQMKAIGLNPRTYGGREGRVDPSLSVFCK